MTFASRLVGSKLVLLLSGLGILAGSNSTRAQDEVIDSQIYNNPYIPVGRPIKVFHERLLPMWLQALERPENDFKRQAADTIALAHQRGMPGLEASVAPLLNTLAQPNLHQTVRLSVAHALIELDARHAADTLFAHAQKDGIDMRNLVEPALARWNYSPVRDVWLQRLSQLGLADRSWISAIQGLATVREAKAIPRLRELLMAPGTDPIVLIEVSKALGTLQTTGLEKDAESLAVGKAGPGNLAHLAAAYLLKKHRGEPAAKILTRLAVEAEPAAALVALAGLLEDDARRVVPLIPRLISSPDAGVRGDGIEAFRRNPTSSLVPGIADLMSDPHPFVRSAARKALGAVARNAEYRDIVRTQASRILESDRWQGLEQAIILMVNLDSKPAAARFLKLLQFDRPEVFVTAAWGLRKLAVVETLPDQVREIERRWQNSGKRGLNVHREGIDAELAQLCESLGQANYASAVPVLTRFIPKQVLKTFGPQCRIAAIWSLGIILEKKPAAKIVAQMVERLEDDQTLDPEDPGLRLMCAISLGRMKAKEAIDGLKMNFPMRLSTSAFVCACGWAMEQITGKPQPVAPVERTYYLGWFLEPNR